MSNNTTEKKDGFVVEAEYPFVNEIVSLDESVTITSPEDASLPVDLSLNLELHDSLKGVLEYASEAPENKKYLKLKSETPSDDGPESDGPDIPDESDESELKPGVLYVLDGKMRTLPYPKVPAVLVVNEEGELEWLEVPASCPKGDDYSLGTYDGYWYWYHIEECDN